MADKKRVKSRVKCPITRKQFHDNAIPILIPIGDAKIVASPKEFKGPRTGQVDGSGSLGWFVNEKVVMNIAGVPTTVQAQLILTVIGSKQEIEDD